MENQLTTHYSRLTQSSSWKSAFTLAETLIVIGIIGVVAALTLPNLNHATGDKEKVTKVKKIYSSLTDAFDRAQAVYGDYDEWFNDIDLDDYNSSSTRAAERITEFMKVSKKCGFEEGCFSASPWYRANGNLVDDNYSEYIIEYFYSVILSDGTSVAFQDTGIWENARLLFINVDIDGPNKGKNQEGSDIFRFSNYDCLNDYENDGTFVIDSNTLVPDANFSIRETPMSINDYPTAWVVKYGNLDYLKCIEDLDWETKTSCE